MVNAEFRHRKGGTAMTKKETLKWIVQIIASVASAILTASGLRAAWDTELRKTSLNYGHYVGFLST
jgi:hypothetical protein